MSEPTIREAALALGRALWRRMRRRGPKRAGAALLFLVLLGWGGWQALGRYWPETQESLRDRVLVFHTRYLRRGVRYRFLEVHPGYRKVDVDALIRLKTPADAAAMRARLIRVVWGATGFPTTAMPKIVQRNVRQTHLSAIPGVASLDKLTVVMRNGLYSESYYLRPKKRNGKLVLYLQGHRGQFYNVGLRAIAAFIAHGYDVLGFSMPIYAGRDVWTRIEGIGNYLIAGHVDLKFLDRPMEFFFEPIAETLNYALQHYDISDVFMVGFSGGGWTATVYAALDPRIRKTYPVSGSYPVYLRRYPYSTADRPQSWGHFEDTYPPLLKAANYLELYMLGGYGAGRRELQVLSQYDGCCYGGLGWTTYRDTVRQRLRALGPGAFDVLLDTTHASHKLSRFALERILADMAMD